MSIFRENPTLLVGYRAGQQSALQAVYATYAPCVHRLVCRRSRQLGSVQTSGWQEDLTQEAFVKAFSETARASFDDTRLYWPYLRSIAINAVTDRFRIRRREVLLEREVIAACSQRDAMGYVDPEEFPELIELIRGCLTRLPDSLHHVYQQRFVQENSQGMSAQNLGLSRRQVRTLEQRLLRELRRTLATSGFSRARRSA